LIRSNHISINFSLYFYRVKLNSEQEKIKRMLSVKDLTIVYEALLAPETMSTTVKISLSITRKQALLLAKVIELGLSGQPGHEQAGILGVVDAAELTKLQGLSADLLKKAGLTEMIDKLNSLTAK
jgi:hypothetical protein